MPASQFLAMSNLTDLLKNVSFQNRHKIKSSVFVRNRKLTFPTIAGMILRMVKQSLQITCNWLGNLIGIDPASKQAFSRARQHLSPECFQELHANGLQTHYSAASKEGLWH